MSLQPWQALQYTACQPVVAYPNREGKNQELSYHFIMVIIYREYMLHILWSGIVLKTLE